MPKQPVIPGLRDAMKKKVTRREQFLAEMDAVVPWTRLLALIAPHYPRVGSKGGRPPMLIETMLRVYFLQNWYALSDPMAEETLYDSEAMRRFARIELGDDRIPDETTILNFRHLLERHGWTEAIFAEVNGHLADKGITLRSGTLVDATIIDAPSSTKNKAKARDPKMSSTKKGNAWYFGMKAHVGVDVDSGTVHSLEATTAKVHGRRARREEDGHDRRNLSEGTPDRDQPGREKGGRGRLIGRTKGGMNTKLHAVCDSQGRPLDLFVTAGQVSDYIGARALLSGLPKVEWLLGDRGYDADWFREALKDKGIRACIPGRKQRTTPVKYDKRRYKRRNRIEIMFGRLKDWRRVATRYDRCPKVFLSAIALAATVIYWL